MMCFFACFVKCLLQFLSLYFSAEQLLSLLDISAFLCHSLWLSMKMATVLGLQFVYLKLQISESE